MTKRKEAYHPFNMQSQSKISKLLAVGLKLRNLSTRLEEAYIHPTAIHSRRLRTPQGNSNLPTMGVTASRLTAQTEPSQSTPSNIREAEADTAVERQCLTQTGPAGATEAVVAARLSSFLASLAPPAAPQPRPRVELDRTHKVTIVSLSPSCTAVKRRASDTSLASYHTSPRKRSTPLAVSAVPAPTAVVSPPSTPQKPSSYSSWQPYEDDNDPCDSVPTPEIFKMPVDFKDVKDWIAEQERLKNRPPLTDAQKRALADLRAAIVENTPEPEISAEDWVTALQCMSLSVFVFIVSLFIASWSIALIPL